MKITILGTGYVGLVAGTCFAELGNDVICADIIAEKIAMLNEGRIPIYEPGLGELVLRNKKEGRLDFTTDIARAVQASPVIFICVGTPSREDGSVNLDYVHAAARDIANAMASGATDVAADAQKIIVIKSTVPVGAGDDVEKIIRGHLGTSAGVCVVSCPEFLREGAAVKDFFNPDRIVIGTSDARAAEILATLHRPLERVGRPILITDRKSSEMIKYASNAFLATKISFINEVARLCERAGADVKTVSQGMGLDTRIGPRFLQAGAGYGGSCFPKDVKGLIATGHAYGIDLKILKAVEDVNKSQRYIVVEKVKQVVEGVQNPLVAVWGLAFKPRTDDIRDAPSLDVIKQLLDMGMKVQAFDPVAEENAKRVFPLITYSKDPYAVLSGAHALVIMTEWDEFRNLDKQRMKSLLAVPAIIDARNMYDPAEIVKQGFRYVCIGRAGV